MGFLTAVPASVASLFRLTRKQNEAIFWVYVYGIQYGYSLENLNWICRQMVQESGWQGSPLLNRNNNPFGMSCTNSTSTTQIGCEVLSDGNTNGRYKSVRAAVKDRFLWDSKRFTEPFEYRKSPNYSEVVCDRYFPQNPSSYRASVGSIRLNTTLPLVIFATIVPFEILAIIKLFK